MSDKYAEYLFHEGTNYRAYELFSPKQVTKEDINGWVFSVWANNAIEVSLVGDFNNWKIGVTPMTKNKSNIWSVFESKATKFDSYKFAILGVDGQTVLKADPYAVHAETNGTASKVYALDGYNWKDDKYMSARKGVNIYQSPLNIYEVHLGSWKLKPNGDFYTYREYADELVAYCKWRRYTHIEILPITEFPFDGSWGYQVTGLFAPTSRFGLPEDFMYFVDIAHKNGLGVILDWVVAHFPKDAHGLASFDGGPTYEYADMEKGEHIEWGTKVFDFGKGEVLSLLISSAMYWCEYYHLDGLRVDAVASMIYLDYARKEGEWTPNRYGEKLNLEAIDFLQKLNRTVLTKHPDVIMIAEESTAYNIITKPTYNGGLGFNFKWNMGWMNDALVYLEQDPFFRKGVHDNLTFPLTYAYAENYILPLSHDEVVHGKRSIIGRCQGGYEQQFEDYKTFLGYYMTTPGKKLTFMGNEFAQFIEWNYQKELDWLLLEYSNHRQAQMFNRELNKLYLTEKSLYEQDCSEQGYKWLVVDDKEQNIFSYIRYANDGEYLIIVLNFSTVDRYNYILGVPESKCKYKQCFSSAMEKFGGKQTRYLTYSSKRVASHNCNNSIKIKILGNSMTVYKKI